MYTPGWGRRAITKTRALVGSCSLALRSWMNRYGGHLVAYRHSHFWVRSVAFAPTSIYHMIKQTFTNLFVIIKYEFHPMFSMFPVPFWPNKTHRKFYRTNPKTKIFRSEIPKFSVIFGKSGSWVGDPDFGSQVGNPVRKHTSRDFFVIIKYEFRRMFSMFPMSFWPSKTHRNFYWMNPRPKNFRSEKPKFGVISGKSWSRIGFQFQVENPYRI